MTWLAMPAHGRRLEAEFDALIGFTAEAQTDDGFGYLDDAGELVTHRDHARYITSRMVHSFALAHF